MLWFPSPRLLLLLFRLSLREATEEATGSLHLLESFNQWQSANCKGLLFFCGSIYIFLYSEIFNTCLQTIGPKIYDSQKPMVLESILRYGLQNAAEGPWKFDVRIEGRLAHGSGPD